MSRKRGRSRSGAGRRGGRGGVMSSMRGGFRSAVGKVSGGGGGGATSSPTRKLVTNVLTIAFVVAAVILLLRRFGVLS